MKFSNSIKILVLIIFSLFISCASTKTNKAEEQPKKNLIKEKANKTINEKTSDKEKTYSKSYKTIGYGNTKEEAKNDALARLSSEIMINVNSYQKVLFEENLNESKQLVANYTDVTSSVNLIGVRYVASGETRNEEKQFGYYYCVVELSEKDVDVYLIEGQNIVNKIHEYYLLSLSETRLQSLDSIYSEIKNLLIEYESIQQILNLIGSKKKLTLYDEDISYISIDYKHKLIREQMISGKEYIKKNKFSLFNKNKSKSDIEKRIKEKIWQTNNKKEADSNALTKVAKSKNIEIEYSKKYVIGEIGPAGGIVFYDKKNTTDGWRYLEVSTEDISGLYIFGENAKIISSDNLGDGFENTLRIIDKNQSLIEYAALLCSNFNEGGYTDWYLPNKKEFQILLSNMNKIKLNNSFKDKNYWTSSMISSSFAWGYSFNSKKFYNDSLSTKLHIRPIRRF